ncbi:MAG: membrane protein insertion efficiency factor YidD [Carnobacterium sp.]
MVYFSALIVILHSIVWLKTSILPDSFWSKFGIKLIEFYQKQISVFFGKRCIYYPTCSEYTKQAIEKYGLIKGCIKGFFRILRCNPYAKGGIDYLK